MYNVERSLLMTSFILGKIGRAFEIARAFEGQHVTIDLHRKMRLMKTEDPSP